MAVSRVYNVSGIVNKLQICNRDGGVAYRMWPGKPASNYLGWYGAVAAATSNVVGVDCCLYCGYYVANSSLWKLHMNSAITEIAQWLARDLCQQCMLRRGLIHFHCGAICGVWAAHGLQTTVVCFFVCVSSTQFLNTKMLLVLLI